VYWLAEQGLAPKRVFLVIIPLILAIITYFINVFMIKKEAERMKDNKKHTIDVLVAISNWAINLNGNIAGSALLANTLYSRRACPLETEGFLFGRALTYISERFDGCRLIPYNRFNL